MKARLSDAIDDYLTYRKAQSKETKTRANDKGALIGFLTFTGNIYVESIDESHITNFLAARSEKVSAGTRSIELSTLRGFCVWAARTKRAPRHFNPCLGMTTPKKAHRERVLVHASKFPALLEAAERRAMRDRMFIALALYTLGREGELTEMRVGDVDLAARRIHMKISKSHREDMFPIGPDLDAELRRWLTHYTEAVGYLDPSYYLVPARQLVISTGTMPQERPTILKPKRPLKQAGPAVVKPALHEIGYVIPGNPDLIGEGAHTLRRSGARARFDVLKKDGYDGALRHVQTILHHAKLSVTEGYIGLTADREERDALLLSQPMYGIPDVPRIGLADGSEASVTKAV